MRMVSTVAESFDNLIRYLLEYSLSEFIPNADLQSQLKTLHKYVYALLCWQIELFPLKKPNMIWLNETVSDFIQIVPLLAQGYYKVCKVMHRSAIENFIKFVVTESGSLRLENTVYRLFDTAKEVSLGLWGEELRDRINNLHTTYGQLCNYVHSSSEAYCILSRALREYPAYNGELLKETTRELVKTLHIVNACLVIMEQSTLQQMYYSNKDAVLDCLSPSEKRMLI